MRGVNALVDDKLAELSFERALNLFFVVRFDRNDGSALRANGRRLRAGGRVLLELTEDLLGVSAVIGKKKRLLPFRKRKLLELGINALVVIKEDVQNAILGIAQQIIEWNPPMILKSCASSTMMASNKMASQSVRWRTSATAFNIRSAICWLNVCQSSFVPSWRPRCVINRR
ncbi:MAG: hypothetical protein HC828_18020 [Blastochloris sp.]|nr:hypothetical protein [Blastochloris sp.]